MKIHIGKEKEVFIRQLKQGAKDVFVGRYTSFSHAGGGRHHKGYWMNVKALLAGTYDRTVLLHCVQSKLIPTVKAAVEKHCM